MLRFDTKQKICDLLIAIGDDERALEVLRQILCEQDEFEPYAGFKRIDKSRQQYITAQDIHLFLNQNGIYHSLQDCVYYIKHYDTNFDGRLSYPEFIRSVLPQENKKLRTIISQRPTYELGQNQTLSYDIEYALSRLIDREIQSYKNLDGKKINLIDGCIDFNMKDAFFTIDKFHTGFIDFNNLQKFFQKVGYNLFNEQIIAILRRVDKDDDGRINFDEFREAIFPQDPTLKGGEGLNQINFMDEQYSSTQLNRTLSPTRKQQTFGQQYKNLQNSNTNQNPAHQILSSNKKIVNSINKTQVRSKIRPGSAVSIKSIRDNFTNSPQNQIKSNNKHCRVKGSRELSRTSNKQQYNSFKSLSQNLDLVYFKEQGEILRSIKQMIDLDKEVEILKQDLALRQDFNLIDCFRIFDLKERGRVNASEIERGLMQLGIFSDKYDLFLFVRRYDRDQDGKLMFSDFYDAIAPKKKDIANILNSRVPSNNDDFESANDLFSSQTIKLLVKLFQLHIENESACEALRQRLNHRKNCDLQVIYSSLDQDNDGFLTDEDLRLNFENHAIDLTAKELDFLYYRFDKNKDNKISISEFILELTPTSPKKYQI